jgi:hypothetical protein
MFTTIAHWFFSTPALIVAVSTRLEPRGGLLSPPVSYHKAVLQGRGLYPISPVTPEQNQVGYDLVVSKENVMCAVQV